MSVEFELVALSRQLEELNRIGAALSAERDTARLLELIVTKARQITDSDAGSLYVVETVRLEEAVDLREPPEHEDPPRRLRFKVAQNDSVSLPFREGVLDISDESIAGYVALTGESVELDDAYVLPKGVPYVFNRSFDEATGYRTQSVLTVPMMSPTGRIVGVLQLLNTKHGRDVGRYSPHQQALARSLAAQAAIALENSQLYAEIRQLFEGFVRASVVAIEARDPATSGHSFRVANLTVALAEAADRADTGGLAGVRFSRDDLRTLRYAALLHDFGKVGVREDILVKAKKLHPAQLDRVRERFRLARRTLELQDARERLDFVLANGAAAYRERTAAYDDALQLAIARLDHQLVEIERANEPNVLPEGSFGRLREIAAMMFPDVDGEPRPLLRDDEVRWLSLRKGSLSDHERKQIEAHVLHTYRFLRQIPWTTEIRRIPAIALGHHEKLNGSGYPYQLAAAEIPVQTRMMTIADIFDALSAADRPYKKAVPVDRALDILKAAVADGELDAELFQLFLDARVYDRWLVEPPSY